MSGEVVKLGRNVGSFDDGRKPEYAVDCTYIGDGTYRLVLRQVGNMARQYLGTISDVVREYHESLWDRSSIDTDEFLRRKAEWMIAEAERAQEHGRVTYGKLS